MLLWGRPAELGGIEPRIEGTQPARRCPGRERICLGVTRGLSERLVLVREARRLEDSRLTALGWQST